MAVTLNRRAYDYAKELINEVRFVFDEREAWSEHQPSAQEENEYLRLYGFAQYGKWYLGATRNPRIPRGTMSFPMGISNISTGVASLARKAGRANTSTMTSRMRQRTCME